MLPALSGVGPDGAELDATRRPTLLAAYGIPVVPSLPADSLDGGAWPPRQRSATRWR